MPNALIRAARGICRGLPRAAVVAAVVAMGTAAAAQARELLLLTSYDTDVVTPLVAAFEAENPDISVRVLNKNTNAAVDELLGGNERHFDLFWASAPEAFEVLAQSGRLTDLGQGLHTDFA